MFEVAKVLKLRTFLGQIDLLFLPNFPGEPQFFQDFDKRY